MKIKDDYVLRQVADSYMAVPVGSEAARIKGFVSLNETGARIWEEFRQENTEEAAAAKLGKEYDIPETELKKQIKEFLELLQEKGFLE